MNWQIAHDDLSFISHLIWHQNVGDSYVYYWLRDKTVLYVGRTNSIYERLMNHRIIRVVEPMLVDDRVVVESYPDRHKASEREKELIKLHAPKYNKYGKEL